MNKFKQPAFEAVIFDIDNVLIDTRRSYLDAIRWTVEIYLTADTVPFFVPSFKRKQISLLSAYDVNDFKLLGGFNDDWDCCYGLLIYLTTRPVKQRTIRHLKQVMKIRKFVQSIKKRPLRVSGITDMFGRPRAIRIEKIARIFQEVYLGKDLFKTIERKQPMYWKKRGLIHREKPIVRKSTLEKLRRLGILLGIATGRTRFEAIYSLKRFGLLEYFNTLVTIDEVRRAEQQLKQSLRKPHPYSLIEAAKKLGAKKRFLYVGDLPDDMAASRDAESVIHIHSAAFPWFTPDPKTTLEEMRSYSPHFLLKKFTDLPNLVIKGHL
ncbi:MAG: HAD hydrolase-like protein [Candidatus Omnitrophica bacterium]|nr:HAD hydrolase-like protein [Candidatus Omnitrophota bacterium]